jgi:outer membrane lipoprotein-sorting protein
MPLRLRISSSLLLILGCVVSARAADVKEIARAVDTHYNNLRSFKGAFTEIYQAPGIARTESGTVWLKKPSRMRWE